MSTDSVNALLGRGCSEHWQTRAEARNECSSEEFGAICSELVALRRQSAIDKELLDGNERRIDTYQRRAELDRQTREASQAEFARLNRERNKAISERDQAMGLARMTTDLNKALCEDLVAAKARIESMGEQLEMWKMAAR